MDKGILHWSAGILGFVILAVALSPTSVIAHGGDEPEEIIAHIEKESTLPDPAIFIKLSSSILAGFIILVLFSKNNAPQHRQNARRPPPAKDRRHARPFGALVGSHFLRLKHQPYQPFTRRCLRHKKFLFFLIAIPVVISTFYLAGHTIYKNITSATKGPVHWHADYELWICGEQKELRDPEGFENKVGTSVLHEHNDNRIHIEGVVEELGDVSLGAYFSSIGGLLTHHELRFPSENGFAEVKDGVPCPGDVQGIFKVYVNGKLTEEPERYVPSPEINVPPGDCIIFDFSSGESSTTEKICESWKAHGWSYQERRNRGIDDGP